MNSLLYFFKDIILYVKRKFGGYLIPPSMWSNSTQRYFYWQGPRTNHNSWAAVTKKMPDLVNIPLLMCLRCPAINLALQAGIASVYSHQDLVNIHLVRKPGKYNNGPFHSQIGFLLGSGSSIVRGKKNFT